jgi:hypothetical protein
MEVREIIIHHSATKDAGTVSWNAIRRYHINECKWNDIGYHFGIEWVEDALHLGHFETLIGRMPDQDGAHTTGHNSKAIGICLIGNLDEEPVPLGQWEEAKRLVRWLLKEFKLTTESVYGHRDFAPKTCPGKKFNLTNFRRELT